MSGVSIVLHVPRRIILTNDPAFASGTPLSILIATAILAAYLTGSVPFGLLTARYAKGIDIRRAGSGNIGATNVGRVLGAKWGIFVLLLDAAKGIVPPALYPLAVLNRGDAAHLHLSVACGLATVIGHMYPCWLGFRGGKGVATALGVVLVLAKWPTLGAIFVFAATFVVFRIVSLSSILASLAFLATELWTLQPHPFSEETWSVACFAIAVPALIILRHRANLARLLRGEEPRYQSGQGSRPVDAAVDDESETDGPST